MKLLTRVFVCLAGLLVAGIFLPSAQSHAGTSASTPQELVAAYSALADTILGVRKTESSLVQAILSTAFAHAQATMAKVKTKIEAGQDARAEIETLAALVSQIGNEGDAEVAGIRKRLIEGGHHHHSTAEPRGAYEEGFVVVTRTARQALLESAGRIGRLAMSPDLKALDSEWQSVAKQYEALTREAGR